MNLSAPLSVPALSSRVPASVEGRTNGVFPAGWDDGGPFFIWHCGCFQLHAMKPASAITPPRDLLQRRVIGEFVGNPDGPTLIAVCSIHGNEPGGWQALQRVADFLRSSDAVLAGRVVLLTGNLAALSKGVRFLSGDLNRRWSRENVLRNTSPPPEGAPAEDLEQNELLEIFRRLLRTAADEMYVLDLHSTSAEGPPFATVGDTMRNRDLALSLPVTVLLGIEEQLEGTLLEFLSNEGAVTLGFEAGQHFAESTVNNHESLVLAALAASGILSPTSIPGYAGHVRRLAQGSRRNRILEVRYRHPVAADDEFRMMEGFNNFDRVKKGQPLARDRRGVITAPESGLIMMPLYQKLGEDGFFITRPVASVWLKISRILRATDIARLMPLLPGVSRDPSDQNRLLIDTKVARFFPLQIFHLLGFRKLRWVDGVLHVTRRRFDRRSPFTKGRT